MWSINTGLAVEGWICGPMRRRYPNGTLESPDIDNDGLYEPNTYCFWEIRKYDDDVKIYLRITSIELLDYTADISSTDWCGDYVQVSLDHVGGGGCCPAYSIYFDLFFKKIHK